MTTKDNTLPPQLELELELLRVEVDIEHLDKRVTKIEKLPELKGEKGDKGDSVVGPIGPQGKQGPKGDKGESVTGPSGKDGVDGKDGVNGKDGTDGKDGSPDTPEQVIEKVNSAEGLIKKDRVEGLIDIERMAKANSSVGITTTFFSKNGTVIGRAKNVNFIEGANQTLNLYPLGDTMNVSISSSGNNGTPVSEEVPAGSGTSFTIAHTPLAGTFKLYRGGARQQSTGDYTLSGTALTLTVALQVGEILLCDYNY